MFALDFSHALIVSITKKKYVLRAMTKFRGVFLFNSFRIYFHILNKIISK